MKVMSRKESEAYWCITDWNI